jgi:hypothetical protein
MSTFEGWLQLSIDHVIPQQSQGAGYPAEWILDATNVVSACMPCNGYFNRDPVLDAVPVTLDAFYDIRDRVFLERKARILARRDTERAWFDQHVRPWMASRDAMLAAYDRLLAALGAQADDLGPSDLATHGPHVGSAYRGLVILGQAPFGWSDVWPPSMFATADGRERVLAATMARNADRGEPLDWIDSSHHRSSPWWTCVRTLTQLLEPDSTAPWYGRFAWVNLYPVARDDPPGNPAGLLRELEDPLVGDLLARGIYQRGRIDEASDS